MVVFPANTTDLLSLEVADTLPVWVEVPSQAPSPGSCLGQDSISNKAHQMMTPPQRCSRPLPQERFIGMQKLFTWRAIEELLSPPAQDHVLENALLPAPALHQAKIGFPGIF
ncbi:hypothetical protein LEMLEM_LOCUS2286 [Lemmus lemmus]